MQVDLKKGDLSATPVTHVIRTIVDQQATGRMEFTLGEEWKVVFFRDGNIISAKSSSPDEQLLELMDRGGVIDHSNLERVRVLINESGWRTPQVEQLIDAGTQKWWMRTLVREVFLSLLEWTDAVFKFVPKISPPDSLVQVEMETMKLLTSILRRIQDTDILADLLGGYETVLQINTSGFSSDAARSMTSQDGFFLSRIDGKLDLRSILTMGGAQKLDMLRSYINASMNGLIEPVRVTEPETEAVSEEVVEESEEPVAEEPPAAEDDGDAADDPRLMFDDSDDIMLTTDELMNLRKLQGRLDSDFLDLSKELNLDKKQEEESVGYDSKVMYLRGGEYVESDGSDGSYDVDQLGRITTHEDWASRHDLDERISLIIGGKEIDGESDLFGSGLSKEIFEAQDEEKQWNLWMISEEELNKDFSEDWTATWTDWIENTQELNKLRKRTDELEENLRAEKDEKRREAILQELKKHNADLQEVINRKKRQIFSLHRRMQLMNYYELLRVERNATEEMIQAAFDEWESDLSPDEDLIREFSSIAPQIGQIMDLLQNAYNTLIDSEKRVRYDRRLESQEKAAEAMQEKKALLAEDHLMSARTANRRGDKMLALRFLRGCISLDPTKPVYYREMASLLAENKNWRREALRFYHKAYHLDPEDAEILYDVADLARHLNLEKFSRRVLQQILVKRPGHKKALRMMQELDS